MCGFKLETEWKLQPQPVRMYVTNAKADSIGKMRMIDVECTIYLPLLSTGPFETSEVSILYLKYYGKLSDLWE